MNGDTHRPGPSGNEVDFDPFAGPEIAVAAPSTEPQREIWTAARLGDDASLAFNESNSLRLRGALDLEALRASLGDLVARHEALRATFSPDGLTLLVAPALALEAPLLDLSARSAAEREAELQGLLAREVETPFDLEHGPLLRVTIVRLGPDDHQVIFTAHHIVVDGWSTAVLVGDWAKLYSARVRGTQAELPAAERFSEYARAQAARQGSPEQLAATNYWVKLYSGSIPVVDLPADRPRPPLKTFASRRIDYALEPDLVRDLRRAGAKHGASFFVTLLGGFVTLLQRLTGLDDLVVGIPAAGQAQGGHAALVGHCVNTLALRAQALPDEPFRALLQRLRGRVLDAFEHQDMTFGALLQRLPITRDPSRQPLVSLVFNVDSALSAEALAFAGLEAEFRANPRHFESFDLFINAVDGGSACVLECQYNTDLFDGDSLQRWLRSLEVLLRAAAADPATSLSRLPLLTAGDRGQVLSDFNATDTAYPESGALHRLFEAQVERTPEAVALSCEGAHLTYRELNARANRLARELRARGVGSETRVGVCLERSHELVVALLGVLKAGGAYVPLDPDYPQERLAFMLQDARAAVLLAQPELLARLPADGEERLLLTPGWTGDASVDASNLPGETSDEQLAYVIYTSGSTGLPKGAMNSHGAVRNRLAWMQSAYGLRADDRVLQKTPFSFDVSVWEFFWTLLYGARLVLARPGGQRDPAYIVDTIRDERITTLHFVPSLLQVFLEQAGVESCSSLRRVVCSGEALPAPVAERFFTRLSCELHNLYGPTEAAVDVTAWACRRDDTRALVPIGRPIANTRLYVLDAHLEPSPVGVPGELFIGGVQVARGYLDRPALTAEKFIPDPFAARAGARLYRTGDLARWLPDGSLEFLGRLDHQVKLRGFRIELGEIEAALGQHPAVSACVVVAREDVPGDKRLVAYFVPREGQAAPDHAALAALLAERLPEYMVPSTFVGLPALPLTPSGKIDRKAMPAPLAERAAEAYVAPSTPAQKLVAELWQETLHVGRVGLHDHFFKLGGHSLLAAQVLARLNREHQVVLPFRSLFEASTLERFAALVERARGAATPIERIPHVERQAPARASLMQERLLLLEELDPERRLVNNIPSAFHLRGRLDVAALRAAVQAFIARHEALRTTFRREELGFVQVVGAPWEVTLEPQDLAGLPEAEREPALRARLLEITRAGFDFERGPLFRAFLFRLGEDEHVFFSLRHNAVWDGWSFDLFRHELAALYSEHTGGAQARLADLTITYSDFAEWHRAWVQGAEAQAQLDWWRGRFLGQPAPLELPTDRPRPAARSYAGADEWILIPRDEADRLTAFAREHDATLFMLLLAAFDVLLQRYSGQTDLCVATPVRARNRPETEDIVGLFTNTLMLRTQADPAMSFLDLLARVRTGVLDAFQHQDVPFDLLAQDAPPMRALFSMQEARHRATRLGEAELTLPHVLPPAAAVDVNFWLIEMHHGLVGALNYSTELFDRATIVRLLEHYRALLRSILRDPHAALSRLALADAVAAPSVADDTPAAARRVSDAALAPAAERPHDVALAHGARRLTWGELAALSEAVAGRLLAAGCGPGARVALSLADPIDALVALFGVWRAGAVALPLDPLDPPARRAAGLRALPVVAALLDDDAGEALDDALDASVRRLAWRDVRAAGGAAPTPPAPTPDAVALVLALADADGAAFGVELAHAALAHLLEGAARRLDLGANDVVAVRPDAGLAERLLPLVAGARAVFVSEDDAESGDDLARALAACGATAFAAPRATWRQLAASDFAPGGAFRALALDALPGDLAAALQPRVGSLWSLWGLEEVGLLSNLERVTAPAARETLGAPLPGVRLLVLDAAGQPVPDGVPGELAVGGVGVGVALAAGGASAARFTTEPGTNRRAALTGWRARRVEDGRVRLLERLDERLHLRGRRCEAGELRAALLRFPALAEVEVGLRDDGRGERRLVAWVVRRPGADFTDSELRRHLRRALPEAFVPQRFVELDALPRVADGRTDARRLPSPFRVRAEERPPRTDAERLLVELWREALGTASVGVHDNFFDLGGHSLLALQLVARVEARTGRRLKPRLLLLGSLEQAAAELERSGTGRD